MPMNKIPKLREPRGPIVQQVRDLFLEREYKSDPDKFYLDDIKMIENMDFLLQRYVIMQRKDVEGSVQMVSQMLKWRKEKELYDVSLSKFPQELTICGAAFNYEEDKFGNKTLYLRASMCKNCNELKTTMKDFLTHLLFKIDDSKNGTTFSVIMDLTNTTWTNYDLDLLMHIVNLLRDQFPVNLDYVLAINFPWILSAAWTLIKRLIPAEKRDVVQFIDSKKVFDFVAKENCPDFLGGTCTKPYKFKVEGAPSTLDYLLERSSKDLTKKRLHEILNLFKDSLPKDHFEALRARVDSLHEDKTNGIKFEGKIDDDINDNNNNIDDLNKGSFNGDAEKSSVKNLDKGMKKCTKLRPNLS